MLTGSDDSWLLAASEENDAWLLDAASEEAVYSQDELAAMLDCEGVDENVGMELMSSDSFDELEPLVGGKPWLELWLLTASGGVIISFTSSLLHATQASTMAAKLINLVITLHSFAKNLVKGHC